jgi:outer membrane protein OmpA-like peptidoglycan-associated protein
MNKIHLRCSKAAASILPYVVASHLSANVISSDFQTFNPTTSGVDFVSVYSAETLHPGILSLGLFVHTAANSLPEFKNQKPHNYNDGKIRNQAWFADLGIGLGLGKNWDMGVSLPSTISQDIRTKTERIEYATGGINELRFNTKYRFLGQRNHAMAAGLNLSQNLIKSNPYAGEGSGPTLTGEIIAHTTLNKLRLAMNLGYRKKNPGKAVASIPVPIVPYSDQYIYSAALSQHFPNIDSKIILEVYGSQAVDEDKSAFEKLQNTAELLAAWKWDASNQLSVLIGGAKGVMNHPVSPDWRAFVGVHYSMGPLWSKQVITTRSTTVENTSLSSIKQPIQLQLKGIHFALGSHEQVSQGSHAILQQAAEKIRSYGTFQKVIIEGHTDSVGSEESNQLLSERRAEAVKNFLIRQHGFDANTLESVGYGESRPIADNENYQGRAANRRVEVRIIQ